MERVTGQFCTVARAAPKRCASAGRRWSFASCCAAASASTICIAACRACRPACSRSACVIWKSSVSCTARAAGKVSEYSLTEAGEELRPIIMALGHWGARWIGSRFREDELDAGLAAVGHPPLRAHRGVSPAAPVVIHFKFRDAPARRGGVVAGGGERRGRPVPRRSRARADACRGHHGARADRGLDWGPHAASRPCNRASCAWTGAERDAKNLWRWLGTSAFAETRRAALPSASTIIDRNVAG